MDEDSKEWFLKEQPRPDSNKNDYLCIWIGNEFNLLLLFCIFTNFMFSFYNYTLTKMILFAGAFELAMIRMSRYFDVGQNAVLFLDTMLPMDAFMTTGDSAEMNLVNQIFDFVKILAEVQLSETALALFSAYILLQEGQY